MEERSPKPPVANPVIRTEFDNSTAQNRVLLIFDNREHLEAWMKEKSTENVVDSPEFKELKSAMSTLAKYFK